MKNILSKLTEHQTLTRQEAKSVIINISKEQYNDFQITALLTVFMMRSITVDELDGFREALQELCLPVNMSDFNAIDIVGTGGDGKDTFNISTLSALVLAGAGEKVVKHGNYSASSVSGSSNVMEKMGYRFTNEEATLQKQVDKAGVCFLHAPLFHPAMRFVGPARRGLGLRTFFNILGPLINPAQPQNEVAGVYNQEVARLYSYVFQQSTKNYTIVHSVDGYDEISLTSEFRAISNQADQLFSPEQLGFKRIKPEALSGGRTIDEAAFIFKNILEGKGSEAQNSAVIANAGIGIKCIHPGLDYEVCFGRAKDSLLGGKALGVLKAIID